MRDVYICDKYNLVLEITIKYVFMKITEFSRRGLRNAAGILTLKSAKAIKIHLTISDSQTKDSLTTKCICLQIILF